MLVTIILSYGYEELSNSLRGAHCDTYREYAGFGVGPHAIYNILGYVILEICSTIPYIIQLLPQVDAGDAMMCLRLYG